MRGTTSTKGATNTPNTQAGGTSQTQTIVKNTQALTKQINDLMNKIVQAKQQAAKTSAPQQGQLTQAVTNLQQQLAALTKSESEESKSQKHKKKLSSKLNNNKHMATKKNSELKESLAGAVGDVAKGAIDTAGDIGGAIPVVGGALKGAANIASRATGAVLGTNEQEEDNNGITSIQDSVVETLAKKKYHVTKVSHQFAEEEGGPTVFLTKRPNRYTSLYAEVSPEGHVNGMSLEEFLGNEENEEKMLSRKQKEIAQAAPPHDKITGADFKALKDMQKEAATVNFLKSISQKKYAEADKYLGSIVNEKIKNLIAKAAGK
jgi:hypothetical protein